MFDFAKYRRKRNTGHSIESDGSAYTSDEVEFMLAMEKRKRELDRFLDCRDVLEVARQLGYRKSEQSRL